MRTKAKAYWNDLREKHPNLIYQRDGGKFTLSKKEVEAFESGLPWAPETPRTLKPRNPCYPLWGYRVFGKDFGCGLEKPARALLFLSIAIFF